eukprot:1143998-Pelagomonas_calceolata.AAC.3
MGSDSMSHGLQVEACKRLGGTDLCDKCSCNEAQDEEHAPSYCDCRELCDLRVKYKHITRN